MPDLPYINGLIIYLHHSVRELSLDKITKFAHSAVILNCANFFHAIEGQGILIMIAFEHGLVF